MENPRNPRLPVVTHSGYSVRSCFERTEDREHLWIDKNQVDSVHGSWLFDEPLRKKQSTNNKYPVELDQSLPNLGIQTIPWVKWEAVILYSPHSFSSPSPSRPKPIRRSHLLVTNKKKPCTAMGGDSAVSEQQLPKGACVLVPRRRE